MIRAMNQLGTGDSLQVGGTDMSERNALTIDIHGIAARL